MFAVNDVMNAMKVHLLIAFILKLDAPLEY